MPKKNLSILICAFLSCMNSLALAEAPDQTEPLRADAGRTQYVFAGEKAYLTGSTSTGPIATYLWDFGDGDTAKGQVVNHVYREPTEYRAVLQITSADDNISTASTTIHVQAAPDRNEPMDFRGLCIFPSDPTAMPWDRVHTDSPDVDPDAPLNFYQHDEWEQELDDASRMGYNALVFITNHPYPYLVKNPQFPEAQPVSNEALICNQATFSAIVDRAEQRGIKLYFLVYNIFATEEFAKAHDLPARGQDSPLLRKYTASYVEAFYKQYPDFGGLVVTVGESPMGCVEFCRESIFEPISRINPNAFLIVRDQGVYTDEMFHMTKDVSNWSVLVKISEEQFTGDAVGPRARTHRQTTGIKPIYLVSWLPDGLLQGSYRMIRNLAHDARSQYGAGFLVQGGKDPEWLFREAFGYYMKNPTPSVTEEDAYFESLVKGRFGEEAPARLFLDTADVASSILPTIRRQLYSRNWNYRARYGLVLESFLSMPSYSGFTLPAVHRPGTNLEKSFMGWLPREERYRVDYLSVREHVAGIDRSASASVRTPLETVQNLRRMADACMQNLPKLRSCDVSGDADLWRSYLQQIEFLVFIGQFYASKLDAAIAWENWVAGRSKTEQARSLILDPIRHSIEAYEKATTLFESMHGKDAPLEPFRMVAAGNKSHYEYPYLVNGGMREILKIFKREQIELRERIEQGQQEPPTFPELQRGKP